MKGVEDIDRATTELYEQVRASPQHADFIRHIEGSDALPIPDVAPRVLVMPGAFHAEYRHTGADGGRVFDLGTQLGWPVERVDVPSLASMQENAGRLIAHLRRLQSEPIILVSLSKGAADVRASLARPDAVDAFQRVRCWINLSGIATGTPLISWLRSRPLRCLGVRLLLRVRRQRFADLEELRHGPGAPLSAPLRLPAMMRAIHVVGVPLVRDLNNDWSRRGHSRLAPLGPNDGGGILLRDIPCLPGVTFPVWGADHYLNPSWDIRPVLLRILQTAALPRWEMAEVPV